MRLRIRGSGRGRRNAAVTALLAIALTAPFTASAAPPDPKADKAAAAAAAAETITQYQVADVTGAAARTRLAATGVAIDEVDARAVVVSATPAQAKKLRALGYGLTALPGPGARAAAGADVRALDFPPADSRFHNYAEMTAAIDQRVAANPNIMSKRVIGRTYQGRDIVAIKISDNVNTDENEPEVLFTSQQHAREHLTVEMALYLLREFAEDYGTDSRITNAINGREIWVIPSINPDGSEYDIATGSYRMWRKNRQPNTGSTAVGTDLNRNWNYRWGCCGGSSTSPSSETYRGRAAESAPEVKVVADFVRTRVVGGVQQIKTGIDFHTYSELVLWPYGYTYSDTGPGMTQDDRNAFAAVGQKMAASNGFTPQQSSDLYITDGSIDDWLWGDQRIFGYTFELFPRTASGGGFYPPDEVIERETSRNRDAVLQLLENSDCMYRSIGKEAQYC
ncbi:MULTISPECIES: M14 family metallopeptidase [Streptomyces]|uniref:Zinc carboxypeptidase n=1 Tax=Streptomyces tsukubensis (strain DSM 42081 / NBRC 108919 / NRRL 18488 / 9993) TaxID=1114943 RepID=I2N595_STRT9|nr:MULTISPECIES: M14 family metallopeptidase [Streptomyces]AZK96215.1 zinc carboxypeptidase [Streptomyces tsukubensis]EIF92192.1 carboxypeptidase [Streptomyces tsukubensis NRRL18488]MYS67445.1 zinc carboxypeptidase [Streptomyces sp. SID5473]QKM67774.1 zinc carboxypeptidase [Streptomyces tsukubensis NRRL18488]TAI44170.1 zinc carboxypeptidase [Streptomyces tsukubensis]